MRLINQGIIVEDVPYESVMLYVKEVSYGYAIKADPICGEHMDITLAAYTSTEQIQKVFELLHDAVSRGECVFVFPSIKKVKNLVDKSGFIGLSAIKELSFD